MSMLDRTVDQPPDPELISRVRGGDVDAYGELFSRHRDAATRLARTLSFSGEAEDLVSDAFVKVLNVLLGGGGPDIAFRAYLLTAVRRLHVDSIRRNKRLTTTDDLTPFDPGVPFADTAVSAFEGGAAAKAFATLPERWQMVLWHLEVENQKPADIAPLLGMSANSVSALAYRAREGLRQAFLSMHSSATSDDSCREVTPLLGAHVRGALSRRDAAKVDEHLGRCRKCAAAYLELTEINSSLAALIAPVVLGGAALAYLHATTGAGLPGVAALDRVRDAVLGGSGSSGAVAAGVAAAAIAGIAATGALAVFNQDTGTERVSSDPAAISPGTALPHQRTTSPSPPAGGFASTPGSGPSQQPQTSADPAAPLTPPRLPYQVLPPRNPAVPGAATSPAPAGTSTAGLSTTGTSTTSPAVTAGVNAAVNLVSSSTAASSATPKHRKNHHDLKPKHRAPKHATAGPFVAIAAPATPTVGVPVVMPGPPPPPPPPAPPVIVRADLSLSLFFATDGNGTSGVFAHVAGVPSGTSTTLHVVAAQDGVETLNPGCVSFGNDYACAVDDTHKYFAFYQHSASGNQLSLSVDVPTGYDDSNEGNNSAEMNLPGVRTPTADQVATMTTTRGQQTAVPEPPTTNQTPATPATPAPASQAPTTPVPASTNQTPAPTIPAPTIPAPADRGATATPSGNQAGTQANDQTNDQANAQVSAQASDQAPAEPH